MKKIKFEYSENIKHYRKENNVENTMKNIKYRDGKMPYFSYILVSEYGIFEQRVRTKKINDNTFQVMPGYGQLSFGIFKVQN